MLSAFNVSWSAFGQPAGVNILAGSLEMKTTYQAHSSVPSHTNVRLWTKFFFLFDDLLSGDEQ